MCVNLGTAKQNHLLNEVVWICDTENIERGTWKGSRELRFDGWLNLQSSAP